MNVSKIGLSFTVYIGNLWHFIEFSFCGKGDIMDKLLMWMG